MYFKSSFRSRGIKVFWILESKISWGDQICIMKEEIMKISLLYYNEIPKLVMKFSQFM